MIAEQIPQIVDFVRKRISERHTDLMLQEREYHLEDEWLYLTVLPSHTRIRASDYAQEMSDIEKELRANHFDNVLLVPDVEV